MVPFPLPVPPAVTVTQPADGDAVQLHPDPAVTFRLPVVEAVPTDRVTGDTA